MSNVYYGPEAYGLTQVVEAEAAGGYEFDKFVIWQDRSGNYLWAKDRGCSCPTPFDSYDLSNLPIGSLRDALTDLDAWIGEDDRYYSRNDNPRRYAADTQAIRELREVVGK